MFVYCKKYSSHLKKFHTTQKNSTCIDSIYFKMFIMYLKMFNLKQRKATGIWAGPIISKARAISIRSD